MTEPTTTGKALIVPNTGDLPGTWGSAAINPDLSAIDAMFAGFQVISLSNAGVSLTVPAGFTATPGAGPTQSQNALIRFTGVLTGNVQIQFPMPGFYIVENLCTVGAFVVTLAAESPGNVIGAPPGKKCHVFSDGTNMDYVNLPDVGVYWDMAASGVPAYITACTVPPWLNCNGGTFSAITYPQLAVLLGGTTLPDSRGQTRFTLNQGTGRITRTSSVGIDGNTLLASGGSETLLQSMLPNISNLAVIIPPNIWTHSHAYGEATGASNTGAGTLGTGGAIIINSSTNTTSVNNPQLNGTASTGGSGLPLLPPGYVGGITLIRAA